MSLPVKKLDDTDFERLVTDARGLIPRYAPDWTDHNLHDPGITLIELIAWVADQEIYRIGYVGESYLKAFAALLGVVPHKARPARGLIWPASNADPAEFFDLPNGTKVVSRQQPDIPFSVETALFISDALPVGATHVQSSASIDLGSLQRGGESGSQSGAGPVYTLRAGAPAGESAIELKFKRPLVPHAVKGDKVVSLGIKIDGMDYPRGKEPKAWGPLVFEYRIDDGDWKRVEIEQDGTRALARTGVVLLRIPRAPTPNEKSSTLRMRLDRGFFPVAPRLSRLSINVVPVIQLETTGESVIGRSNGLPDQAFRLEEVASVAEPEDAVKAFELHTEEEGKPVVWQAFPDFDKSNPDDNHFVVDTQRKHVQFGNGINGRIPPRGAQVEHRGLRTTKGKAGNLGSRQKWSRVGAFAAQAELGTNIDPMTGGQDVSTTEELIAEARQAAFDRKALLTNAELQRAAETLAGFGVSRAQVLVRHDPAFPDLTIRGTRTLIVIPNRDAKATPGPVPRAYLDAVREALAPYRLLGERLLVRGPVYVKINIALRVMTKPGADRAGVRTNIEELIRDRLTDLRRRKDRDPWPMGRPVTAGEIKGLAARVPDVISVTDCRLSRAPARPDRQKISLDPAEIAIAGEIDPQLEYETGRSA
jgi:hypothetical protein